MAYRIIDPKTGFIEYKRSPEENSILDLKKENENLRRQVSELFKLIKGDNEINKKEE